MTEPARLGQIGSPLTRELLRAGREELPSEVLGARAMRALGLAAGGAVVLTAAAPASSAAVGGAVVVKWAGMGILAGVIAAGSLVGVERLVVEPAAMTPSATAVARARSARPMAVPAARPSNELPDPEPARPRSAARNAQHVASPVSSGPPPVSEDSLAREVAALDEARAALRRHDLAAARRVLDAYEAAPDQGALRAEALYLRIETLVAAGERSAATEVARHLLRAYPGSAPAARARELVGPQIP